MAMLNAAQFAYAGGRLKYVVVPIKGKVKRVITSFEKKQIGVTEHNVPRYQHTMKQSVKERPGGFMVYFPMGHVLRLTERQLRRFRLNRPAGFADMRGLFAQGGPLAELLQAQTEEGRAEGFKRLELMTVHLATKRTGTRLLTREERIPDEFEDRRPVKLPDVDDIDYKSEGKLAVDAA